MSIKLEHVNYIYSADTAYEKQALKDIWRSRMDSLSELSGIPVRENLL